MMLCWPQDESNPDFVAEVVELYFEDSASKLDTLQARLAEPTPSYSQARVHSTLQEPWMNSVPRSVQRGGMAP